ncbi:type I restriction-modification enzyme R subunit C-terminal domain-containing protein [Streptomyces sp. JJ38]|uniref:type I restriction-modification enzyme R subunit C-terminal domain-containing protein n=1 Tax=Streptomyces sp. JJ38 TaxID=2738128 RepID=UPI001C55AD65|nr:type I restriction-modification enzyme R subunit C-terminal domain-containing protein [Streptomyces sp. JJ38]MBW1600037.1 hypothetical protein [Streptomyces sp. JJ38]
MSEEVWLFGSGPQRQAAEAAFSAFQQGETFTSAQLRFVDLIIDYLARNGTIDVEVLYQSPFDSLAPRGPEELFEEAQIDQITAVIRAVHATAVATQDAA